jgi:hypothetical protein
LHAFGQILGAVTTCHNGAEKNGNEYEYKHERKEMPEIINELYEKSDDHERDLRSVVFRGASCGRLKSARSKNPGYPLHECSGGEQAKKTHRDSPASFPQKIEKILRHRLRQSSIVG